MKKRPPLAGRCRHLGRTLLPLALAAASSQSPAADALYIDSLGIIGESTLILNYNSTPFYSEGATQLNNSALLPPVAVAANTADPWGQSFSLATQSNSGFYRIRTSVVDAYPPEATDDHPYDPVFAITRASAGYQLSVGALVPDAPLQLTLHIFGGHLAGSAYYEDGRIAQGLKIVVKAAFDGAPLQTFWSYELDMTMNAAGPYTGWTMSTPGLIDPQGIGVPGLTLSRSFHNFTSGARVDIAEFKPTLDFGVLQPGHTFQLAYSASFDAQATFTYPGVEAGIDLDLIDPLSLGGDLSRPPFALPGLTLPAPVPQPPSSWMLAAGLLLLGASAGRRQRRAVRR